MNISNVELIKFIVGRRYVLESESFYKEIICFSALIYIGGTSILMYGFHLLISIVIITHYEERWLMMAH